MGEAPTTIRVLSVSRVAPSTLAAVRRVKLSCLDVSWVWLPAVQHLFLYEYDLGLGDAAAVIARLKAALADTLTYYLPLAGTLEYEAEVGDLVVDCSSNAGVAFIEAEAADGMDVRRLAYDEAHDMPAFVSLVPELHGRVLPAPVLSVQVTWLQGASGLAVGMSMHHAVADGRAMWEFVEAWASSCRGSTGALRPPIYCRDAIHHYPRADELAREWLKIAAPNLPVVSSRERDLTSPLLRLARRTFHLCAGDIRTLKKRIDDLATAAVVATTGTPKPWKPVSTFVALAALGWTAFVHSKGLGAGDDTYLMFLADLRPRLDPPVTDRYLGNCVMDCVARCTDAAEIAGEAGLLHAARAVQAAVAEMKDAPLHLDNDLSDDLPFPRLTNVVGSPSFQGYAAADFGFGKPALAVAVSMNHDGEMMLLGGPRDGEVQLSVSIHPAHMATYMACIRGYLHCLCRSRI